MMNACSLYMLYLNKYIVMYQSVPLAGYLSSNVLDLWFSPLQRYQFVLSHFSASLCPASLVSANQQLSILRRSENNYLELKALSNSLNVCLCQPVLSLRVRNESMYEHRFEHRFV